MAPPSGDLFPLRGDPWGTPGPPPAPASERPREAASLVQVTSDCNHFYNVFCNMTQHTSDYGHFYNVFCNIENVTLQNTL